MRKYFPIEKDLDGFNEFLPSDHIPVAGLPDAIREQKSAWLNTISVRAIFSAEVEDGDLVVPVLRDESNDWYHPDTVWVPALGPDAVMQAETETSATYQPKFYGMAYKGLNRVMLGPLVYHPTYKFRAGDILYATTNGKMTTEQTEVFVGACLAPGYVLLHGTAQNIDLFKKAAELTERAETAAATSVEMSNQVVEVGEAQIKRMEELAEQLLIIGVSYNKYAVADISVQTAEGTQIALPEYEGAQMSYIVGSNTLLLCYNGTWMLPGEQYTEVGTAGLPSAVIQLNQELRPGDKLGVLILSQYTKVLLSVDSGLGFKENGELYIAPVTAEGTEDTRTLPEWAAAIRTLEQPVLAEGSTTARTLTERFADVVNVKDFGAKGDGVTDDSAAFTAVEALDASAVFVPEGSYKLTAYTRKQLTKHYFGFGELLYGDRHHEMLIPIQNPMVDLSAPILSNGRSVVFIGDSITAGFGKDDDPKGPTASFVDMMQQMLAERAPFPQTQRASFANLAYEAKSGSYASGTAGPIKQSLILQPGAAITVATRFVDLLQVFYARTSNTTILRLHDSFTNTAYELPTIEGEGLARVETPEYFRSGANTNITVTNIGTNAVELTGIGLYSQTHTGAVYLHNFACPAYTTEHFASDDVLNAIATQTFNRGYAPVYVIALGTNDCYASLVTPERYKENLTFIVSGLLNRAPTAGIVLCQPWLRFGNSATLGTPKQYRDALIDVANKYKCAVFDCAELDFNSYNDVLRADSTHPSPDGYKLLASWFWKKLGLDSWKPAPKYYVPTFADGISPGGGFRLSVRDKRVYACGHVDCGSTDPQNDALILTVSKEIAPRYDKYLLVGTNGSAGIAVMRLKKDGTVSLLTKTPASLRFLFFEGVSWSLEA